MKIKIAVPYRAYDGNREFTCRFPSHYTVRTVSPLLPETALSDDEIRARLLIPFSPGNDTLYVINDLDRETPTAKILNVLGSMYPNAFSGDVLIATGAHTFRALADEIAPYLIGDLARAFRGRIFLHDAKGDRMIFTGSTSRKTVVVVSERLFEYANIITIGSVEPHWFAGYTGGRKSLIPGVASFETIRGNHALASHPGVAPMKQEGNPVFEDLMEAARIVVGALATREIKETSINAIAKGEDIFFLNVSPVIDALPPLVPHADRIYAKNAHPADLLIAIAESPMDRDLYQAMKSFENVREVISSGGAFLLVASCAEGYGPPHFSETLSISHSPRTLKEKLASFYTLGDHKFKNPLAFTESGGYLAVSSPHLFSKIHRERLGFFTVFPDSDAALQVIEGRLKTKKQVNVLIVRDAVNTVLFRKNA